MHCFARTSRGDGGYVCRVVCSLFILPTMSYELQRNEIPVTHPSLIVNHAIERHIAIPPICLYCVAWRRFTKIDWKLLMAIGICTVIASAIIILVSLQLVARDTINATPDWVFWLVMNAMFFDLFVAIGLIVGHCIERPRNDAATMTQSPPSMTPLCNT